MNTSVSAQNAPSASGANLDQCSNGPADAPVVCDHDGGADGWVNGNAVANHAHWAENQFISYRLVFSGLDTSAGNSHTIIIAYNILKLTGGDSKHAIDYVGTYNYTETTANPCNGGRCTLASPTDTFPVPQDPDVTSMINPNTHMPIVQIPGVFTMWGGDITDAQYLPNITDNVNKEVLRRIQITFSASSPSPVLAWGGHIAWIGDWGVGNSASAISGSPYHTQRGQLDDESGNHSQDVQLQNSAVVQSGAAFIVKVVNTIDMTGASSQSFPFTATAGFGVPAFSLIDDNAGPGIDTQASQAIINFNGIDNVFSVTEGVLPAPWTLLNIACVDTGTANSTPQLPGGLGSANIIVDPGEVVTCTFTNSNLRPTAAPANIAGRVLNGTRGISGAVLTLTDLTTGQTKVARSNMLGYYSIANASTEDTYQLTVSAKGYTFANNSRTFTLMDSLTGFDFVATPVAVQPTSIAPPVRKSIFGGARTQGDQ